MKNNKTSIAKRLTNKLEVSRVGTGRVVVKFERNKLHVYTTKTSFLSKYEVPSEFEGIPVVFHKGKL